jgi:hypothetical protein
MMLLFVKLLVYVIFTFIVLSVYLNKLLKIDKIIQLTLVIGSGLFIIGHLIKTKDKPVDLSNNSAEIDQTVKDSSN